MKPTRYSTTIYRDEIEIDVSDIFIADAEPDVGLLHPWLDEYVAVLPDGTVVELTDAECEQVLKNIAGQFYPW